MRKILIISALLFFLTGVFTSCKKEKNISYDLAGRWVNEQNDTIAFLNDSWLYFRPYNTSQDSWISEFPSYPRIFCEYIIHSEYLNKKLAEDFIQIYFADADDCFILPSYSFKYFGNQIEIVGFLGVQYNIYKRIK